MLKSLLKEYLLSLDGCRPSITSMSSRSSSVCIDSSLTKTSLEPRSVSGGYDLIDSLNLLYASSSRFSLSNLRRSFSSSSRFSCSSRTLSSSICLALLLFSIYSVILRIISSLCCSCWLKRATCSSAFLASSRRMSSAMETSLLLID